MAASSGVQSIPFTFKSAPAAKCYFTASMFPFQAAVHNGISGALAVGGFGFAASATGSVGLPPCLRRRLAISFLTALSSAESSSSTSSAKSSGVWPL